MAAVMGFLLLHSAPGVAPAPAPAEPGQPYSVTFDQRQARFVRVLIHATNGGQPCIDELEVYGPGGGRNLALASGGARASASSLLPGHAIHQITHLNDGRHGNANSWIAATTGVEWAQVELPAPAPVARVVFSRDREGAYNDRVPVRSEIQLSSDGREWLTVAQIHDTTRRPARARRPAPPYTPPAPLPEPVTWDGLVRYAFLCERATWGRLDAADPISPLQVDRPALPGGAPYWGRIARLAPTARVLTLLAEMIDRLAAKGLDVAAERSELARLRACRGEESEALYLEARMAKRRLMLRDPDLAAITRILFVKRHPYLSSHNYSDVLDSQFQPGGGVCILEIPRTAGRFAPERAGLRTLFDASAGIARDPAADFDAGTVFFAYRPDPGPGRGAAAYWHLYGADADGARPARRLTDGHFHDYYPCPLPDGGLAFISTRCRARFLCWRPQAFVLFRIERDGSDLRPLSFANLSEWSPALLRDGRILWTRSEYIDKGADFGHTLWAIRPDGMHPELVYGNNTPNCYMNARPVPGTHEILCTIFSHGGDHNGPLGLIDLARASGPSDPGALTNLTPDTRPHYNMNWPRNECWRDPTPVTRDLFLASHAPADRFGLYLVDRYGNRELLYLDPAIGSMSPSPMRPEPAPPALEPGAPALDGDAPGQFTVADVYRGLEPDVPRGAVRYIRVCEEVRADLIRMPDGSYQQDHTPFQDWYATPIHKVNGPNGWPTYVAKAVLGLAPVAPDGSANFLAPSGKVLYFQALDAELNEIQRMRSVVQLQPGERRGCVGCHENRLSNAPVGPAHAARRAPDPLEPPPWGAGPFAFERVVQPVLDARCVRCHDGGPGRPGPDLRGVLDAERVPASYRALVAGGWVHYFDMTYKLRHEKAAPNTFGIARSRLWTLLDAGHHDVALARDEIHALKCWVDLNCPLWPDYRFRPERPPQPERLAQAAPQGNAGPAARRSTPPATRSHSSPLTSAQTRRHTVGPPLAEGTRSSP